MTNINYDICKAGNIAFFRGSGFILQSTERSNIRNAKQKLDTAT